MTVAGIWATRRVVAVSPMMKGEVALFCSPSPAMGAACKGFSINELRIF